MSLCGKGFFTALKFASVRLNPGMDSHVSLQISILGKLPVANCTLERSLVGMGPNMYLQPATPLVLLPAILTFIGFFSCVNKVMGI